MQRKELIKFMSDNNSFMIKLQAILDKVKSLANIKEDIKAIETKLPKIKMKGTLDKTATNKELKARIKDVSPKVKVDADVTSAEKKIKKLGKQKTKTVIQTETDNSQVVSGIKEAQKETKTLWERFTSGITGINLIQMGVQKIVQTIHQAIVNIKELDAIKTNIQMASGTSDSEVNAMMGSYNRMAKDLSSTTKDVAEAANEFLRMGESIETTNELVRSSQILSKVGMIESADAASYLISSLKGYKVAAEDSLDIVSKLTSVDLEAAVSAGGLAEAISRCSSIANNSGTSMDRLIGYTAAVGEVTQESMSVIGNAFKSIYSRMNNIKIGRFIDDETGESLSDTEAVLNKLGIQLRDTADTYRNFDDVLNDIGTRWKDFTQVEQNAISVAMAGTMQRNRFLVLMNNWTKALEYSEVATNSAGNALERYGVYQDSIEAKTNELTAALESLSTSTISEGLYSGIIEATTGIVEFLDKTNLLKGALAGIVTMGISKTFVSIATSIISASRSTAQLTAAMKLFDNGKSIANLKSIGAACKGLSDQQLKLVLSTKGLNTQQRLAILTGMGLKKQEQEQTLTTLGFATAENIATASTFSLKGALNSLGAAFASNPIGFVLTAISALATIIPIATSAISKHNQKLEEARQKASEAAEAYRQQQSSLDSQIKKYRELKESLDSGNLSIDEARTVKEQLLEIQNSLADSYGVEASSIDLVNGKYKEQLGLLDELSKQKAEDFIVERRSVFKDAKEELEEIRSFNIGSLFEYNVRDGKSDIQKQLYDYVKSYSDLFELRDIVQPTMFEDIYAPTLYIKADAQSAEETMIQFAKDLKEYGEKNAVDVSGILNGISEQIHETQTDELKESRAIYDEFMEAVVLSDSTFRPLYQQSIQAVEGYNKALSSGEGVEEAKANLESVQQSVQESIQNVTGEFENCKDGYQEIFNDIYDSINRNTEAAYQMSQAFENDESVKGYAEQLKGLTDFDLQSINFEDNVQSPGEEAFKALIDILGLSQEEVQKLIDKLVELGYVQGAALGSAPGPDLKPLDLATYKDQIDNIQSSISTLRSALESFNRGELDKIQVIDLMQEFPDLVPYIDLTAEGFGSLSEGLSELISKQPDTLVQELEQLKDSLDTEEERQQIDFLIDSLQRLSSYGDSGIEAYAATIGNTWNDTANVIESVTTQFENLAKVQETVADGLTITATAAAELAKMYPEILTSAQVTADGQITLNEDVVKSILEGDKSIVGAQIAKLEADRALLTAKKTFAEAQLEIVRQVGEGEGKITAAVAQHRIDTASEELKTLIELGTKEEEAYAIVAQNMAGNMEEYNRIVGNVAEESAENMRRSAKHMADALDVNAQAAQESMNGLQRKIWDVADAVASAAQGVKGGSEGTYAGGGSRETEKFRAERHRDKFRSSELKYSPVQVDIDGIQTQLELDIEGYTDAISNIDSQIEVLKNLQLTFEENGGIGGHGYADRIKELEKEKSAISDALKDAKSEFSETIDFFERRVDALDNSISLLKSSLGNVSGSSAKNSLIDAELGITEEKFNNYTDALSMYTQKADEALSRLPADIAAKVKDGAVALTDFIGDGNKDVVEAIKDYESWAGKISDCKRELAELKATIRQLELEKFNNIVSDFTDQFDLRSNSRDLISKQIDLLKESGQLIGESFFTAQIDQSKKQLELLENEKAQLVNQMSSAISSGRVQKGTDEWLSMVNALSDVDGSILDCKKSIEEFDNSILELHWQIFQRIQTEFGNISSELSNLAGLFDKFNDIRISDGKGTWTNQAIATLGLYAQQYEVAKYQVDQYSNAINKLKQDYADGRYSATEYMDRLADLTQEQWDAVKSTESAKDAIMDLNEARVENQIKGIEKEIDAFDELTQSQIRALKAEKDLREYENSITDKTKAVTDLEYQIEVMKNDTSAATAARRRKLEEQLAEARKDLEEEQYQHSIEVQEDALNRQYENYEKERNDEIDRLRESLNDRETILAESFNTVKENASLVGQEIATIATEHGITISNSLISSWKSGETAIASYGEVLSESTSAFIGNIIGVENETWNLQAQANLTSDSLAWMFSTKADTLVDELAASYCAGENLNIMAGALQQSLTSALERGYDISGIVDSLNGIADAMRNAGDEARRTRAAMDELGSAGGRELLVRVPDGDSQAYTAVDAKKLFSDAKSVRYAADPRRIPRYADGTRHSRGGIIVKDEEGPELMLEKLTDGRYTVADEGSQIFTKEQTERLSEMSQMDLRGMIPVSDLSESMKKAFGIIDIPQSVLNGFRDNTKNNSLNIHYDSLVTVNGDVNDTNHFTKQVANIAHNEIVDYNRYLNEGVMYGSNGISGNKIKWSTKRNV